MFSQGSWSVLALVATGTTLMFAGGAVADRGGVPNGGREDRPQPPDHAQAPAEPGPQGQGPQGPPAAQQQPQEKATPPGQERRPESAPAPPGQERRTAPRPRRPAEPAAKPQAGQRSAPAARRSQSRNAPPGPEGNPNQPGTPDDPAGQGEGKGRDKTTICHSTGSESNGFVEITVANPALPAHERHGDLVPAPAGGCPGAESTRERIDICHATGSETNPFVLLENMPMESLNGHGGHEGDIIPAPEGGCPTAPQPAGTLTEDIPPSAFAPRNSDGSTPPGAPGAPGAPGTPGTGEGGNVPASGVLGVLEERPPAQGVLPASATGSSHNSHTGSGSLPFTGLSLLALIVLGVGALAGGAALRRGGSAQAA